jgi:hypothetical protein
MSHTQVTIDVYYDLVILFDYFLSRLFQILHKIEFRYTILDEVQINTPIFVKQGFNIPFLQNVGDHSGFTALLASYNNY